MRSPQINGVSRVQGSKGISLEGEDLVYDKREWVFQIAEEAAGRFSEGGRQMKFVNDIGCMFRWI